MFNIVIIPLILVSISISTSPPILNRSFASQILLPNNSAISSLFPISSSSALLVNSSTSIPALRVPPSWSFSIGFLGDTFLPAQGDSDKLSFTAQLDTGDPLPGWLSFDGDMLTLSGVAPRQSQDVQVLNIVVTAVSGLGLSTPDTFALIVSPHDLSLAGPLLTRNVTADTKFSFVVNDWQGVQVDGASVQSGTPGASNPSDNTTPPLVLSLDTTSYPWLAYDPNSLTLTGAPPASYAGVPGPLIPAVVTLAFPPQSLTVSTNLTIDVFPSLFTTDTLPPVLTLPGASISFDLSPFLSKSAPHTVNLDAKYDPQNATWLHFNPGAKSLSGTVPEQAPPNVKVSFTAHDPVRGTDSLAEMLITINHGSGDSSVRTPTDRALRTTAKKVTLAVGLVCGIIASIILLASLLAICRRYCASKEHVDGAYVVDQSAFDEGLKSSGEYEKGGDLDSVYHATQPQGTPMTPGGRMITKGAFFNAMRERLGSSGSWPGRRAPNSSLNSAQRTRKSKISKPMAVLSSSTSVRDGFADRARGGLNKSFIANPFHSGTNFTIFGNKNNLHGSVRSTYANHNSAESNAAPPGEASRASGGGVMSPGSSPGTAILAYDRSRSSLVPSQNRTSASGSRNSAAPGSNSAPSMGMGSHSLGTQTGTQSTFATGDSTRLTNAAGEVPFRRPDFDGRRETLVERNMREMGNPGLVFKTPTMTTGITTPPTVLPAKVPLKATLKHDRSIKPSLSSKSLSSPKPGPSPSASSKNSPQSLGASSSSRVSPSPGTVSKPGSQNSLRASSYRKVFFGDKGNESDGSSADDVEHAVISQAVQRTSNDALARLATAGKPRLVAFTHERTPEAAGQARRDVSQKVVVQGEDSDPEAELRMGLEYVRRLGHPEAKPDTSRPTTQTNASLSRASLTSKQREAKPVEFYASNDSNGSIAGRTRVMSHLVINSHRHRHHTAYSTESGRDSFVTSGAHGSESHSVVQGDLPRIILGPGEPFNFAAPLDRAHKHASSLAGSALQAKQADGRALPEWLRFRNIELEFWGVSPSATNEEEKGTALVARVVVNIWEAEKSVVVGGCVIDVMAGNE